MTWPGVAEDQWRRRICPITGVESVVRINLAKPSSVGKLRYLINHILFLEETVAECTAAQERIGEVNPEGHGIRCICVGVGQLSHVRYVMERRR